MKSEAKIDIYRRLTGVDSGSIEEATCSLRQTLGERLAPPGRPASMVPRAFEIGWSLPHAVRPAWERVGLPLLASCLAGTMVLVAAMGL